MSIEALKDGIYKGKGVEGGVQWGEKDNGNLELILDLMLETDDGPVKGQTFLYMTESAAPYSIERLKALGWKGESYADLHSLAGIGDKIVDVQKFSQVYEGKPQHKLQIVSGGGRFETKKPVDPKLFAARVAAIMGKGSGSGNGGASKEKPPF